MEMRVSFHYLTSLEEYNEYIQTHGVDENALYFVKAGENGGFIYRGSERIADGYAQDLLNLISSLSTAIENQGKAIETKADKTTVADLNESVQSAVGKVSQFEQDMQDLNTDFSVLSGTVEDNTEKISANSTSITGLVTRVEEAEEALKATAGDVASEIDRIEQAYKAADNALDVKISANTRLIGEKETALDNKITENTKSIQANSIAISGKASQSDLNDLKEMVDTHEESITDSIDPALTNHTERIGVLENDLKELLDTTIPGIVKKEADDHSEQANSINAINTALEKKSDEGHNHDNDYDAKGAAQTALTTANLYTDTAVANKAGLEEMKVHTENTDNPHNVTAAQVGALPLGSVSATANLASGTKVGSVTVNGTTTDFYCEKNTDTKNTAGSTNSSSKLFLIGATSQAANPQTYSHDTVYVGTDGCLYSDSKQVVNLSGSQALTNKTYNGYKLAAACAKGVATSVTSGGTNLPTAGAVYTALENLLGADITESDISSIIS